MSKPAPRPSRPETWPRTSTRPSVGSFPDHHRDLYPSHAQGRATGNRCLGAADRWHAMVTLGEIFRRYGPAYRAQFGDQLSAEQIQAMRAIEQCRTEALGGQVYTCPACATTRYSYHSCRNRHCPTCQQDASQTWLAHQQDVLLPVPHFLVTFTLPSGLRAVARQHPRTIYTLLFRASAAALQQLAQDPRFLGGQIGMLGVLQTWTRDCAFTRMSTTWCPRSHAHRMAHYVDHVIRPFWSRPSHWQCCFGPSCAPPLQPDRPLPVHTARNVAASHGSWTVGRLGVAQPR